MSARPWTDKATRDEAWGQEHCRREQASTPIHQYQRGLITLDELIAELGRIRLDERQWATPGGTMPMVSANLYARLLAIENEEASLMERPWRDPARLREIRAAVEDEHSHGGTPTLEDGCR